MRFRSWLPMALALLIAIAGAAPLAAVTPRLVKDINPLSSPGSSSPDNFVAAAGVVFFTAADGETGSQLWRTDGTLPGTFALTGVCPGGCSRIRTVARTDRSYFFLASGAASEDLWVTSGTLAGTFRLTSDLVFGLPADGGRLGVWLADQGLLYFSASDGPHGFELWRSDGTPAGTHLVADVRPGPQGSEPLSLTGAGGRLFFSADAGPGRSLWKSDGTPQGTQRVRGDLVLQPPFFFEAAGRTLFFTGLVKGRIQLWRSDGTAQGTFPLTSGVPSPVSRGRFIGMTPLGNRLFFVMDSKGQGQELWVTEGSLQGTRRLTNWSLDDAVPRLLSSRHLGNRVVFPVDDGVHGYELWATDGTPAGTRMVRDLCSGSCLSFPSGFEPAGRWVYFQAHTANGPRIWRTNGTAQGTVPLASSVNFQKAVLGSTLVFSGYSAETGFEIWRSDGTPRGTGLLADLNTLNVAGSYPRDFLVAGDKVYFYASDERDYGLWRSDGTETGTSLFTRIERLETDPPAPPTIYATVEMGGAVFIVSEFEEEKRGLWRLDASSPVPVRLTEDLNVGVSRSSPVVIGNTLYFTATDEAHGDELWKTDGTVAGTRLVADLSPGPSISQPADLTAFQGRLYFTASGSEGSGLWRTNGTEAGTVLVVETHSFIEALTEHAGRLWFVADTPELGRELWSTDGTSEGTRVHDLIPGPEGVYAHSLLWAGSRLFLSGGTTGVGIGLWVWDGTEAAARRISDAGFAVDPFRPSAVLANGNVYFSSPGRSVGFPFTTLWKSDGTEAGTVQILDRNGMPVDEPASFQAFAGKVYFKAESDGKLYQTDGTNEGTFPILTIASPDGYGFRHGFGFYNNLVRVGPRLMFGKWDRATGTELWALEAE